MQLILREDVHNLGKSGDVVTVKPGYGRNYLIPQKLAVLATANSIRQIEHEKKKIAAHNATLLKDAQSIADKLAAIEIQIERQAGEGDRLFGSVNSRDVTQALQEKGITVDHRKVQLPEPLKSVGYHTVEIKLGQSVVGKIKVVITPKH